MMTVNNITKAEAQEIKRMYEELDKKREELISSLSSQARAFVARIESAKGLEREKLIHQINKKLIND